MSIGIETAASVSFQKDCPNYDSAALDGIVVGITKDVADFGFFLGIDLKLTEGLFHRGVDCNRFSESDMITFNGKLTFKPEAAIEITASLNGVINDLFDLGMITIGNVHVAIGAELNQLGFGGSVAVGADCLKVRRNSIFLVLV
jgi:hypothetical protein